MIFTKIPQKLLSDEKNRIIPQLFTKQSEDISLSTLTQSEIQKIAELSKLSISENKLSALSHDLENILKLVEKMNQAKTQNVEPLSHPLPITQPMRDDIVTEKDERELFQKNSKYVEAGLYIVPKFVEE